MSERLSLNPNKMQITSFYSIRKFRTQHISWIFLCATRWNRFSFTTKTPKHVCPGATTDSRYLPLWHHTGVRLVRTCDHFFRVIPSNLLFVQTVIPTWGECRVRPLFLKPVPYLPLVCASVFDGPWLGGWQSLINWWVWLPDLCWGCKPSAFHSNRQPQFGASLCLQLFRAFVTSHAGGSVATPSFVTHNSKIPEWPKFFLTVN